MDEIENSKEQRIRKITHLYYSKPEVQKALFEFSKDREVVPRYFEGFGKRPDSLQYESDIFELVKKGATSFHCSEELWKDPLKIETGMVAKQLNELRKGWDLLIDIDSKYIDYSKIMAEEVINFLKKNGVRNVGVKFSGSKGFHIIVPWKAIPKEINGNKTSDMFPEFARIAVEYIYTNIKKSYTERVNQLNYSNSEYPTASKYIKRESGAPEFNILSNVPSKKLNSTSGALSTQIENLQSTQNEKLWNKQSDADLILVSPRHLFRMPYSLHEKTSKASIVLSEDELKNFQLTDADPMNVKIKNFMPDSKEREASRLFLEALDWYKGKAENKEKIVYSSEKLEKFKQIKFEKLTDNNFPPSIQKILSGIKDGKKRALFILINFFRSINMDKEEIEKRILDWNKKNLPPLNEGYIKTQLSWSYRKPSVMPPNYDKDYYKGIGITPTSEEVHLKNPVSYMIKKNFNSENPKTK
ncbi:MAG: DNA primase small subunit domain-containing protein [Candidatus Nanoarchaeia archaeon]